MLPVCAFREILGHELVAKRIVRSHACHLAIENKVGARRRTLWRERPVKHLLSDARVGVAKVLSSRAVKSLGLPRRGLWRRSLDEFFFVHLRMSRSCN